MRGYHLEGAKLKDMAAELNYKYNALRKRLFDCRARLHRATEAILSNNSN